MKIAVQCFNYAPHDLGGSERSSRDIAQGMKSRGHEVCVVLSDGSKDYPKTVDDIPVHVVEGLPIGKSPLHSKRTFTARMAWNLRSEIDFVLFARAVKWLRRERPDVMLMNNPAGHGSAMMAACRMTGTPFVPVIRDYGWICAYGIMMRRDKPCETLCGRCKNFSTVRRNFLSKQPTIVAISEYVANLCRQTFETNTVQTIYNAVPERFLTTPPTAPRDRSTPLIFGYLGRLHPSKGINQLVDAWNVSGVATDGHRLLLAGDNLGINLPENMNAIGIDALGRQDAIAFLDRLDVLVQPALWAEPFGRTVVEGLARGLFVIGSPMGGLPELISSDRGVIPECIDVPTLSKIFGNLTTDPDRVRATRLSDPTSTLQRFRMKRMLDAYESVLTKTVEKNDV